MKTYRVSRSGIRGHRQLRRFHLSILSEGAFLHLLSHSPPGKAGRGSEGQGWEGRMRLRIALLLAVLAALSVTSAAPVADNRELDFFYLVQVRLRPSGGSRRTLGDRSWGPRGALTWVSFP